MSEIIHQPEIRREQEWNKLMIDLSSFYSKIRLWNDGATEESFILTEADYANIFNLVKHTITTLDEIIGKNNLEISWSKFVDVVKTYRDKFGKNDDSAKELDAIVIADKVELVSNGSQKNMKYPEAIKYLFAWSLKVRDLKKCFDYYHSEGKNILSRQEDQKMSTVWPYIKDLAFLNNIVKKKISLGQPLLVDKEVEHLAFVFECEQRRQLRSCYKTSVEGWKERICAFLVNIQSRSAQRNLIIKIRL